MKKAVVFAICLLILLLLCGCEEKEQNTMEPTNAMTVRWISGVPEADVWILPDTAANRKTTVWGAPSAAKVPAGDTAEIALCDPGDGGLYLLRMIDADGYYYAADGLRLEDGGTVQITETDILHYTVTTTDKNGALLGTYDVFAAKL